MAIKKQEFFNFITEFEFQELFLNLGWNLDKGILPVVTDNISFEFKRIAEKQAYRVLLFKSAPNQPLPDYTTRKKLENRVSKVFEEHLIIWQDHANREQIWQVPLKRTGKPKMLVETRYITSQQPELLYQRASGLLFNLNEEGNITIVDVTSKVATQFAQNAEKVTKKFYDQFKKEHGFFLEFISGIEERVNQEWYASLMLNRLMFCYFIQKREFLDGDKNYLRNKLTLCQEKKGKNQFYSFYRNFILRLFHEGLGAPEHSKDLELEIGKIPYLNGGLFDHHELENQYSNIDIDDKAFDRIFTFFDQYEWHLNTDVKSKGTEINPDVIGYIFEKYINDRAQMGAYYTKEDITEYISKNCILPFLFDRVKEKQGEKVSQTWFETQLKPSGDTYIYPAVKHGIPAKSIWEDLPDDVKAGLDPEQPDLVEKRRCWNRTAPETAGLPTEIWREVIERRKRYEEIKTKISSGEIKSINDFITYNLNIRQFTQDLIENSDDPVFIYDFYEALTSVTILDPTCGSGAFLFAALNILEPLYEACINRMYGFIEDEDRHNHADHANFKNNHSKFRKILQEIQNPAHPSQEYFIYKSIILRNLFGVDLMKEAVEIAKLRLFLKLVAAINQPDRRKPNMGLEPLPDIDFNVRSGNTLVGFANVAELKKALFFATDPNLEFTLLDRMDKLGKASKRFREMQLAEEIDFTEFKAAKTDLDLKKKELNIDLNDFCARTYDIHDKVNQTIPIEQNINGEKKIVRVNAHHHWLESHQPFHWLSEFFEIIHDRNGFDVIIGNPPYVEYSDAKSEYRLRGFATRECGNLFAFVSERAMKIGSDQGFLSFIVPISISCTQRMKKIQQLVFDPFKVWVSNYGERPSKLFSGAEVLLNIFIVSKAFKNSTLNTTSFIKWKSEERSILFEKLIYNENSTKPKDYVVPKIGLNIEHRILAKIKKSKKQLQNDLCVNTNHLVYYRIGGGRYWKIFTDFSPKFVLNGNISISSRENYLYLKNEVEKDVLISILSSSLFYWYFIMTTNCRDLNPSDIKEFPISIYDLTNDQIQLFSSICFKLMNDYQNNSKIKTKTSIKTGVIQYQEFYPKFSKVIIDEIDSLLAIHFNFTVEELEFIINYDIKYRMGSDLDEEE